MNYVLMMRSMIFIYLYAIVIRITIHLIYIGVYYINFFQKFFSRPKERNRKRSKNILQDELKKSLIIDDKNLVIILFIQPYIEYIINKVTLFNFLRQIMVILLLNVLRLRYFWFYQEFMTLVSDQWICMHLVFPEWWKVIL